MFEAHAALSMSLGCWGPVGRDGSGREQRNKEWLRLGKTRIERSTIVGDQGIRSVRYLLCSDATRCARIHYKVNIDTGLVNIQDEAK